MKLVAELRHCTWRDEDDTSLPNHVVELDIPGTSDDRRIVDNIAFTRNIPATWIVVKCTIGGVDVTDRVHDAYHKKYGARAADWL